MKKFLLFISAWVFVIGLAQAQTTILDFESPATSTTFQYFGSPLDGSLNQTVDNPNPGGINTSSKVGKYVKPAVAETWAGAFSNPNPTVAVDLTSNGKVSVKVLMDHIGNLALKLEGAPNGETWIAKVSNTKVNEWEELVFDVSQPSLETPFAPASGLVFARVVLFFDFGTAGTGSEVTSYFDDIIAVPNAVTITNILDFETPATGTTFQYFGSPLDGSLTQAIANPNPSGINTSATVLKYVKPAVAETWAGAFSNPNPATPVDFSAGGQICVKVHMDHIGNLTLKLEGSTSGQPNWITKVSNTKVNEWEELCFDASVPSIEAPLQSATGIYSTITLFFDFGTAGTGSEVTSYLDDVVVKTGGGAQFRTVSFKVDMNSYTTNFDTVYLSGTFNNWSGNANPLSDPEQDGIWEGSLDLPNGLYEYKVTLDNWAAEEHFTGFEECTKKTDQFSNRLLSVGGNTEVPKFCFNSCYACGEEVKITFKLGMNNVPPSPDGVWLSGGGNFDVPGGKYKMDDSDGDGIFQITVPRKRGFSSFYAFANGACPDFSCKEDLTGQPCGNPNNFYDRTLPSVQADTTLATCYEACFTNAECISAVTNLQQDENLFELLGNPSSSEGSFLAFGESDGADKTVLMTNSMGQLVGQWSVPGSSAQFELPIAGFQAGMYQIIVRSGERFYSRKLVK